MFESAGTNESVLRDAIATVPAGRWVVGVSGGADSVALLHAVRAYRPDVSVVVAHLNHESRGAESDADAAFVESLAASLGVEATVARLSDLAPLPTRGLEAAYRQARMKLFRETARATNASGVLLAHHANDRAETVLLRLLRGGEPWAIGGLRREAVVGGVRICRPLVSLRPDLLRAYLGGMGQPWREDATNQSPSFARNRVRAFLHARPELISGLLDLATAADRLRDWIRTHAATLPADFAIPSLADLPDPLARASARRWLLETGVPEASAADAERLIQLVRDHSTAAFCTFRGGKRAHRSRRRVKINDS